MVQWSRPVGQMMRQVSHCHHCGDPRTVAECRWCGKQFCYLDREGASNQGCFRRIIAMRVQGSTRPKAPGGLEYGLG